MGERIENPGQRLITQFMGDWSEEMKIAWKVIELDKKKKATRCRWTDNEDVELYEQPSNYIKEKRKTYLRHLAILKEFDDTLSNYLKNYGTKEITCITVREWLCGKYRDTEWTLDNPGGEIKFDPRFGHYQFIKFKFRFFSYVCAILPFVWFTQKFAFNPKDLYIPETDDATTLRLLKIKEREAKWDNIPSK